MSNVNNLSIPINVQKILDRLNDNGYEAYIVGGCVRDMLLGIEPKDWDITTNAKPAKIKTLFHKTIDTGIQHGTVTVVMEKINYEVTTYRADGPYIGNRKPESVSFLSSIKEDLNRRDFTINAMAYHPDLGLQDPFFGMADLEAKVIRTVGDPDQRFSEDALRMLRAVRFSAQLGFEIDNLTLEAIKRNRHLISAVSSERIRDELTKTLMSDQPAKFKLLYETGLLKYFMPEMVPCFTTSQNTPYHIYNVGDHSMKAVSSIEKDKVLRWVMLLHDIGKPPAKTRDNLGIDHFYHHPVLSKAIAEEILKRLHFDNRMIQTVSRLVEHHDRRIACTEKAVRKALHAVGDDIFEYLLKVKEADLAAQNPALWGERPEELRRLWKLSRKIMSDGSCIHIKDLAIKGGDLLKIGYEPGIALGDTLEALFSMVLNEPELNQKDILLAKALEMKKSM